MTITNLESFLYDFVILSCLIFIPTYLIYAIINRKHRRNRIKKSKKVNESAISRDDIYNNNKDEISNLIIKEARVHELTLNAKLKKDNDRFKIEATKPLIDTLFEITFKSSFLNKSDLSKRALTEDEQQFALMMLCLRISSLNSESRESIKINSYVITAKNTPYTLAIIQRLFFIIGISQFFSLKAKCFSKIESNPEFYDKLLDRSLNNINKL